MSDKIELTKSSMISFIHAMMACWEISIHDIFENDKTKLMIVERREDDE